MADAVIRRFPSVGEALPAHSFFEGISDREQEIYQSLASSADPEFVGSSHHLAVSLLAEQLYRKETDPEFKPNERLALFRELGSMGLTPRGRREIGLIVDVKGLPNATTQKYKPLTAVSSRQL